ncbi:MAG: hypothetical protein AAGL17_09120 [Cyanobacteria bacterium J06576_12]
MGGMNNDRVVKAQTLLTEQIKKVNEQLKESGIESAEVVIESQGILGTPTPVIKSFRIGKGPIQEVAEADPGNISQVAASQLEIINSYYQSVLHQAKESFQWALVAAASGLIFFLVAIGFLVNEKSERISNVSLISGALVEVVAGINFYLYSRASNQLSSFHTRLDVTQRFLLANSLCENLEGELKNETRADLVRLIANYKVEPDKEKGK